MEQSILQSIKKLLGIDASYTAFDTDIIMYINSVFPILAQLGIGPPNGYMITDATPKWADYLGTDLNLNMVQPYMWMQVKLMFDPPDSPQAISALERQIEQFGWRINLQRESELLAQVPVVATVVVAEEIS